MNNTTEKNKRHSATIRRVILLSTIASAAFLGLAVAFVDATDDAVEQVNQTSDQPAAPAAQTKHPAVRPRSGHSDYLRGLTRSALRDGFGQDGVLLLTPQPGPGRDAVAKRLQDLAYSTNSRLGRRLNLVGLKASRPDDTHVTLMGSNGYVKVSADGTKFEMRGDIDNPNEIQRARASGRMLEKGELERLGRNFVKEALESFVRLGNEETLTFLGAKYLRDGNYDEDTGKAEEEVVANIAIFGREVRGVPVIGSGSKIAVWFANDREPVGFDVDWPVYQVQRTRQSVLSRERLNHRVSETTVAITGSQRAEVARFECGYVDLGGRKRGAQLQAGCAIHYAGRHEDGSLWARVEYVPAGEKVNADPKWPLSRVLATGRTMNTDTTEFARYASTKAPPKTDPSPDRPPRRRNPR